MFHNRNILPAGQALSSHHGCFSHLLSSNPLVQGIPLEKLSILGQPLSFLPAQQRQCQVVWVAPFVQVLLSCHLKAASCWRPPTAGSQRPVCITNKLRFRVAEARGVASFGVVLNSAWCIKFQSLLLLFKQTLARWRTVVQPARPGTAHILCQTAAASRPILGMLPRSTSRARPKRGAARAAPTEVARMACECCLGPARRRAEKRCDAC